MFNNTFHFHIETRHYGALRKLYLRRPPPRPLAPVSCSVRTVIFSQCLSPFVKSELCSTMCFLSDLAAL